MDVFGVQWDVDALFYSFHGFDTTTLDKESEQL